MSVRRAVCAVAVPAVLLLAGCSTGSEASEPAAAAETNSEVAVSADPQAPELSEDVGTYTFNKSDDDGSMRTLAVVKVRSADSWMGVVENKEQFTVLDDGKYRIIARGASGCAGPGSTTDEGLGVLGEVHVVNHKARVWNTPSKVDSDSFATVVLVDDNDKIAACAKSVRWQKPTEEK